MGNDIKAIIGIVVVSFVIVVGGVILLTKAQGAPKQLTRITSDKLIRQDSHKNTTVETPVTIVEFGDFECPACGTAYPIIEKIVSDYQGKVALVFRHFPLPQHKNAMLASLASESADQEGKFWMMYNILYSNQSQWVDSNNPMDQFLEYADQIRMDRDKFRKPIDEKKYEDRIKEDEDDGIALNIKVTPTFFINGIKVEGTPSYQALKDIIDQELANSK